MLIRLAHWETLTAEVVVVEAGIVTLELSGLILVEVWVGIAQVWPVVASTGRHIVYRGQEVVTIGVIFTTFEEGLVETTRSKSSCSYEDQEPNLGTPLDTLDLTPMCHSTTTIATRFAVFDLFLSFAKEHQPGQ